MQQKPNMMLLGHCCFLVLDLAELDYAPFPSFGPQLWIPALDPSFGSQLLELSAPPALATAVGKDSSLKGDQGTIHATFAT
jgi:hypothetical protein